MRVHGNCTVDGCTRPANYKQDMICQMHYFRRMRNGRYDLKKTKYQEQGYYEHSNGYKILVIPGHPIARPSGEIFEHRAVMFQKYGWNIPPCEICGAETSWASRKTHVDHIDENKKNNNPENLRILCNRCNTQRTKKIFHKHSRCTAITAFGETKTAEEWSRDSRVDVRGSTINRRIRNGMSPEQALTASKKTHNGGRKEKLSPPPKHARKNAVSLTIDGITMTSAEWSRHPLCPMTDSGIRARKRRGMPDRNCVFDPPSTGKNAKKSQNPLRMGV